MSRVLETSYSLDVESDGPVPGLYSMISLGFVNVENPKYNFYGELRPISENYNPEALAVSGITREQSLGFRVAGDVMKDFEKFIKSEIKRLGRNKLTVWADNPGFDWGYLNYYMHCFLKENILGFSARRIGDLYAGNKNDIRKSSEWKRMRGVAHTHNALDDAMGNAIALKKIVNDFSYKVKSIPNRNGY